MESLKKDIFPRGGGVKNFRRSFFPALPVPKRHCALSERRLIFRAPFQRGCENSAGIKRLVRECSFCPARRKPSDNIEGTSKNILSVAFLIQKTPEIQAPQSYDCGFVWDFSSHFLRRTARDAIFVTAIDSSFLPLRSKALFRRFAAEGIKGVAFHFVLCFVGWLRLVGFRFLVHRFTGFPCFVEIGDCQQAIHAG